MTIHLEQPWVSFIDGGWAQTKNGEPFEIADPGRPGETASRYGLCDVADVDWAVTSASRAFGGWKATPAAARAAHVYDLIDLWKDHIETVAEIVTREMGKPLVESRSEAIRAVDEMRFWAGEALRLGDRTFESTRPLTEAYTVRQPIGPVAAISPWNFPILTPIRKVIPALICGCTVVLKPALQAPGASVLLVELLRRTGVPKGVVNLLIGRGGDVGDALVNHPDIAGITFTGSTQVGIGIGVAAAKRNARVQLEMGGKNAAIVAGYGDIERAADEIVKAAFAVAGQRCTSISRVIVPDSEKAALEAALVARAEKLKVGYGLDDGIEMGPLSSRGQFEKVQDYIDLAKAGGGRILTGGTSAGPEEGCFIQPTIVSDVAPGTPLADDEIFGPLLVVIPVADFEAAVQVNNRISYGLTSAIFTDRMDWAHAFCARSEAGMVHVNHGTASEGHLPFGGWKNSGQGAFGIGDTSAEFYTSLKAVYRMYQPA